MYKSQFYSWPNVLFLEVNKVIFAHILYEVQIWHYFRHYVCVPPRKFVQVSLVWAFVCAILCYHLCYLSL